MTRATFMRLDIAQSYNGRGNAATLPHGQAEAVHKLVDSAAWTDHSCCSYKKYFQELTQSAAEHVII